MLDNTVPKVMAGVMLAKKMKMMEARAWMLKASRMSPQ